MAEMYSEYVAILGAPLAVIIFDDVRMFYELGYIGGVALDLQLLMMSAGLQFLCEVVVDFVCIWVEARQGVDVAKA